jgi:hypothetical protein
MGLRYVRGHRAKNEGIRWTSMKIKQWNSTKSLQSWLFFRRRTPSNSHGPSWTGFAAANFSVEVMVARINAVYRELAQRRRGSTDATLLLYIVKKQA